MSRVAVRNAVASYLENANITNLTSVFPYPPKLTPEGDFYNQDAPNHTSGAIIFLWIEAQRETRIALGGSVSGKKMVEYTFVLDCYFRSSEPKSEDASEMNDAFLDSLVDGIRANREAGTSNGVIFVWGEGPHNGGADVEVTSYYPRRLASSQSVTQTYSNIRVMVLEEINS
jgi:hypothetical protein